MFLLLYIKIIKISYSVIDIKENFSTFILNYIRLILVDNVYMAKILLSGSGFISFAFCIFSCTAICCKKKFHRKGRLTLRLYF